MMKTLFAGLDVSDEMTAVCIVDDAAATVFQGSVRTTPADIISALKPHKRKLKFVGFESGDTAIWLNRELARARYPVVCLDTRHAHSALGARLNKTDTNDARGLAELVARGIYTTAYVKSDASLRIRTVLALRASILRKAHQLQQAMKMSHRLWGGEVGPKRRPKKRGTGSPDEAALLMARKSAARSISFLNQEAHDLRNLIVEMAEENEICRRLMTIPGVGPITAMAFVAAVDDPTRFRSSRDVAAYFGLTPRVYQSGKSSRSGRISRRGDASVRAYLYTASQVMVSLSHSQCRLRLWAQRVAQRKGNRFAFVACSRKLAVLMHRIWISGETFDPAR